MELSISAIGYKMIPMHVVSVEWLVVIKKRPPKQMSRNLVHGAGGHTILDGITTITIYFILHTLHPMPYALTIFKPT